MTETAAVILAAGKGTRMKSRLPKVLHAIAGRAMIDYALTAVQALGIDRTVVVIGPGMEAVAEAVAPVPTVVQERQLGTADAVLAARGALEGVDGTVLVLFGDTPLISAASIEAMLRAREEKPELAAVVLGFRAGESGEYGRLVIDSDGTLEAIIEARDATPAQRRIDLCNSGVMALAGNRLFDMLELIGNDNAKGEYYLTDIVSVARRMGADCGYIEADAAELMGINSRQDLAAAEAVVQGRMREAAMRDGVTLTAPETVWFSYDTVLGEDVTIGPGVVFGPGVIVGDGVEIRAFCHIEGARIAPGATIGPFARLRPGTVIETGARVGNFVEVKNAVLEEGAKANHLSYLGDARVGAGANIGAGTITCNYDGYTKSRTDIGAGAFIGSNTALVAPVTIGDRAIVGAGSAIARDVEADALALTRAPQDTVPGWAARFRTRKAAAKAPAGHPKAKGKAGPGGRRKRGG